MTWQLTDKTALIIVDVQDGLDEPYWGERNNPDAEKNMARLLAAWRSAGRPIYHVQHMSINPNSPLRPGLPGNAIKRIVAPQGDEPVLQKNMNSAFIGTDLEKRLKDAGIQTVVIVGLTTEHCISSTVRMAANLGFKTGVVADATAANEHTSHDGTHYSADAIHNISLVTLQDEFATILKTDELVG